MDDTTNSNSPSYPVNCPPRIPPGPLLSLKGLTSPDCNRPGILGANDLLYLTSGRMAIALALELERIGKGDEVLIPAYHCSSMVAPVVGAGATPVFYRIRPDMSVDMADLADKCSSQTKCMLVTHYFGFPQDLPTIKRFGDEHHLVLIEDCAHAIFGEVEGHPIGSMGDYAIGSLMKFFPVYDGGVLTSFRGKSLDIPLQDGGKSFQLQSLLNMLELSFKFGRLPLFHILLYLPLKMKKWAWSYIKSQKIKNRKQLPEAPTASQGGFEFDPAWIHKKMSIGSRGILELCSTGWIADRRRANYRKIESFLKGAAEFQPIHTELPENVVPYVYPVLISDSVDRVNDIFYNLRQDGVPLMRWETLWTGMDDSVCETSQRYSLRLIQIPCHQELSEQDIAWMTDKIKDAFCQHGSSRTEPVQAV